MIARPATARMELQLSRDQSMQFLGRLSEIPSLRFTIERGRMTPTEVWMVVSLQGGAPELERALGLGRIARAQGRPAAGGSSLAAVSVGSMAASSSESSSA